jgi:hypothetical protein
MGRTLASTGGKNGGHVKRDMAANKTDANDADGLAHLAEVGSYKEVRTYLAAGRQPSARIAL